MSTDRRAKELPARDLEALSLFAIPYTSDSVFLWCPEVPNGATEVSVSGEAAAVHSRRKLLRPGGGFEVLLVQGNGLRDGAPCTLHVGAELHACRVHLAQWEEPDTRAVMKLVVERFALKGRPARTLERYLAYISSWQAANMTLYEFSHGRIVEIRAVISSDKAFCYGVTPNGVERVSIIPLLHRQDTTVVWLADPAVQHLYLESAGNLIRVSLSASLKRSATGNAAEPDLADQALIEALHQSLPSIPTDIAQWAARGAPRGAVLRHGDDVLDVRRLIRLSDGRIAVFLDVKGAFETVEVISLTPFGATEPVTAESVRCALDEPAGERQNLLILRTAVLQTEAWCYRLTCSFGEETRFVWISVTASDDRDHYSLARDFSPAASVKADWFNEVIHPVATGFTRDTAVEVVRVDSFGAMAGAHVDVHVFAGSDLEALHRTLIGLALTSRDVPLQIYVAVFDRTIVEGLLKEVQRWSDIYRLAVEVRCYSRRTVEAQVIRGTWPAARPAIYCRAGAVPHHPQWLLDVLQQCEVSPSRVLVGTEAVSSQEDESPPLPRNASHRLWAKATPALIAFAAAVPPHAPLAARLSRFFTMEGFFLARGRREGLELEACANLSLVSGGAVLQADEFCRLLDLRSLQMLDKSSLASVRRIRVLPRKAGL